MEALWSQFENVMAKEPEEAKAEPEVEQEPEPEPEAESGDAAE